MTEPDLSGYLTDAAHFSGGHAAGVAFPRSTAEVVEIVRGAKAVLPIGAQSSLTGGATPMGELVIATSKMARILERTPERIVVEPGVSVWEIQQALHEVGGWFPPAPTYTGACAGGIVATNAAGAATFKYGSTRSWVEAMTVVLADGSVLDLTRGTARASDGALILDTLRGPVRVPLPRYRMPVVPKLSAGYYTAPDMDPIDLFIGSEGTLGVITRIALRAAAPAPAIAVAYVPCPREQDGLSLVAALRRASMETWRARDPHGIDIAAIEHVDRRSIEILREDGADHRHGVRIPPDAEMLLLIQIELPPGTSDGRAFEQIQRAASPGAPRSGLEELCRRLDAAGLMDDAAIALPAQVRRIADLFALREAVPAGVNARVGAAKRDTDARIEKTAADMIVPVDRFGEMLDLYREGFSRRGLDFAIWGHISDGNVHPNVIPRTFADVERGREAILEFGRAVTRLGGAPLAEHGVGRSPIKQRLLQGLYGPEGVDEMRRVKAALDPEWKLAPGVVFQRSRSA